MASKHKDYTEHPAAAAQADGPAHSLARVVPVTTQHASNGASACCMNPSSNDPMLVSTLRVKYTPANDMLYKLQLGRWASWHSAMTSSSSSSSLQTSHTTTTKLAWGSSCGCTQAVHTCAQRRLVASDVTCRKLAGNSTQRELQVPRPQVAGNTRLARNTAPEACHAQQFHTRRFQPHHISHSHAPDRQPVHSRMVCFQQQRQGLPPLAVQYTADSSLRASHCQRTSSVASPTS